MERTSHRHQKGSSVWTSHSTIVGSSRIVKPLFFFQTMMNTENKARRLLSRGVDTVPVCQHRKEGASSDRQTHHTSHCGKFLPSQYPSRLKNTVRDQCCVQSADDEEKQDDKTAHLSQGQQHREEPRQQRCLQRPSPQRGTFIEKSRTGAGNDVPPERSRPPPLGILSGATQKKSGCWGTPNEMLHTQRHTIPRHRSLHPGCTTSTAARARLP